MFRQGVVSSISNPAPYYIKTQLEPDMINVGWVLVSSNIAANSGNVGSEYFWDVLWSSNASNQIGKDWFLCIGWDNASNSTIVATVVEQWNGAGQGGGTTVGANQALGYPPNFSTSGTAGQGPNNWCNVSQSTLPLTPNSNCGYIVGVNTVGSTDQLSPVSFTYSHSVSIDCVITMSSNTAAVNLGHAFYLGTYDTFLNSTVDVYPVVAINFNVPVTSTASPNGPGSGLAANTLYGVATREPAQNNATALAYNFVAMVGGPLNSIPAQSQAMATQGAGVDYYANKFIYSRSLVIGRSSGMRGLLKNCYVANQLCNRGDTVPITINGQVYTAIFVGGTFPVNQNGWWYNNLCFLEV